MNKWIVPGSSMLNRVNGLDRLVSASMSRRRLLAGSLGVGLAGLLAACGDDEDEPTATTAPAADPTATSASEEPTEAEDEDEEEEAEPTATEAAAEPTATEEADDPADTGDGTRMVETMHGLVEVPADPQRIVVLNYDATGSEVLSLLEIPVLGIDSNPMEMRPEIQLTGELNSLGNDELDVEAVAALQPDLITGMFRSTYADALDSLRQIAPVALLDGEAALEWREVTLGFGEILNRADDAQALIDETEALIAEVSASVDTSKTVVVVRPNADGTFRAYTEASFPGLILAELGIDIPEPFQEVESTEGTAGARGWNTLSAERLGELDAADMVIFWAYGLEPMPLIQTILDNPLWSLLSVATEERYYIGSLNWYGAGPISVRGAVNDVAAALGEGS